MINRLLFLLLLLFPVVVLSAADELRDEACLDCHGVTGFAVPTGETGDSPMRALDINADALRQSVHGKLSCVMCHADIEKLPHGKEGLQAVDCVTCHARLAEEGSGSQRRGRRAGGDLSSREKTVLNTERYRRSIHGDPTIENNAACKGHLQRLPHLPPGHRREADRAPAGHRLLRGLSLVRSGVLSCQVRQLSPPSRHSCNR